MDENNTNNPYLMTANAKKMLNWYKMGLTIFEGKCFFIISKISIHKIFVYLPL